jgi:hypothetical protein
MILPSFIIPGTAKSGTTSMYQYLKQCKEVFLLRKKELRYFCSNSLRRHGGGKGSARIYADVVSSQVAYEEFYRDTPPGVTAGEVTPHYLYYYHEAVPRIKAYLGDPRIFILLRDPVERAWSHYKHLVRDMREHKTFEQVITEEEASIDRGYEFAWHFKRVGLYYEQVKAYREAFSTVRTYIYEDWKSDLGQLANEVLNELAIPPKIWPKQIVANRGGVPKNRNLHEFMKGPIWKKASALRNGLLRFVPPLGLTDRIRKRNYQQPQMDPSTRQYLCDYFREDVQRLSDLLGRDLVSQWLDR